jgi:hypothetical protein
MLQIPRDIHFVISSLGEVSTGNLIFRPRPSGGDLIPLLFESTPRAGLQVCKFASIWHFNTHVSLFDIRHVKCASIYVAYLF